MKRVYTENMAASDRLFFGYASHSSHKSIEFLSGNMSKRTSRQTPRVDPQHTSEYNPA